MCTSPFLDRSKWWLFRSYECAANALRPWWSPTAVHAIFTQRWSPCTFHRWLVLVSAPGVYRVSVSSSHIRNAIAMPLLSFTCNWSLFLYRQTMPTVPPTFSNSLLGHVFIFPSKQRLITIFHSGFDLQFLNLYISQVYSFDDYPFHPRCQLVSMNFTGLDQTVILEVCQC